MIALPLSAAQIQPAKHCFYEIRWLKFIKTLTLQTWAKEINIFENIFSCLNYFRSAGLHFFLRSEILKKLKKKKNSSVDLNKMQIFFADFFFL